MLLIVFLVLLGVAALLFLGKVIYQSPMFTVKKVESNVKLNSELVASVKGRSLFTVNTNYLYKRISSNHVEYKDVSIVKKSHAHARLR